MFRLLVLRREGSLEGFQSRQPHSRPFTLLALCTVEVSFEGALPIPAPSLFSLFATKRTKLTPPFSYPSTLFKKECLPKPFPVKQFRTLSQNTRGCTLSAPLSFNFNLPALFTLSLEGSGVEGSTFNRLSPQERPALNHLLERHSTILPLSVSCQLSAVSSTVNRLLIFPPFNFKLSTVDLPRASPL